MPANAQCATELSLHTAPKQVAVAFAAMHACKHALPRTLRNEHASEAAEGCPS